MVGGFRGLKSRLFGCRKYHKLFHAQRDRELSPKESSFLEHHRSACYKCDEEMAGSNDILDILRMSAMEAECSPHFDDRVVRKFKLESAKAKLTYWSPAVFGAAVAGLVILAALQMIAQSGKLPVFRVPGGEARLSSPAFPSTLPDTDNNQSVNQ